MEDSPSAVALSEFTLKSNAALAAVSGRDFALPDAVKKMAQPILAHRITLMPLEPAPATNRERRGQRLGR